MKKILKDFLWNNPKMVPSLLEKCNPFGLTMEDGTARFFHHPNDAYVSLMMTTFTYAPKGYVELNWIMTKLYPHLPYLRLTLKEVTFEGYFDRNYVFINAWDKKDARRFFEKLCAALCACAGTSYRSDCLESAWQMFIYRIQVEKLKNEEEKK